MEISTTIEANYGLFLTQFLDAFFIRMILFLVEDQQQLECVCEDGSQTESNHNIQDRSEVASYSSPVERDSVQFGHYCAGKNNIMHSV